MKFQAAMFDFDGTITEKGVHYPPSVMADALVDLANEMPIAFCTGRQLGSFERHGMKFLMESIKEKKRPGFLKNLHLIAENGSIGYYFDVVENQFKEFYRVPWPTKFIDKDVLRARLDEVVKDFGEVYYNAHQVIVVIRTKFHYDEERDVSAVYSLSDKIFEATNELLRGISSDFGQYLHVGNSGIGVIVCPAEGDKDRGIREFANYLKAARGMEFGPEGREIFVVGDRPQLGGNDYYFLNGEYGSAFNVGEFNFDSEWPKPVINEDGKRLLHYEGTLYLVRKALAN